jgi:hypothetical protein
MTPLERAHLEVDEALKAYEDCVIPFGSPCLVTSPGTFCRGPHAGASQHGVV